MDIRDGIAFVECVALAGSSNDSTANQWFDESHFENYRAMGEATGRSSLPTIEAEVKRLLYPVVRNFAKQCFGDGINVFECLWIVGFQNPSFLG
jgi:hypothetical protein